MAEFDSCARPNGEWVGFDHVNMPTSQSSDLSAALVSPSTNTVAAVGARITSAIAATNSATTTAQSALVAAWYQGNHATCTKVAISVKDTTKDATTAGACLNTPAAHADEMASLFETNMHYGHGVARIKVQQALAILHDDLNTGIATATRSDVQKDIIAHMLVPMYQGAIKSAYDMDKATDKAAALANGAAYWSLIKANVPGFSANDNARLTALFDASAASGNRNYCEVQAMLKRNLPDGSMLQYGQKTHVDGTLRDGLAQMHTIPVATVQHVPQGKISSEQISSDNKNPIGQLRDAVEAVHLQERDIGEIAGVAVGATVGGIVLLVVVGLVLRSLLFKSAKPVFTCLEKAPAEKKAPTPA